MEAGQDIAVYAYARMTSGASAVAVMSVDEVYSIRDNSQGWQAFKRGITKKNPWDPADWVSEQEMKKKTALRRLCKVLPLSPEFRDAVEKDDEEDPIAKAVNVTPSTPLFQAPAITSPEPSQQPAESEPAPASHDATTDDSDTVPFLAPAQPDPAPQAASGAPPQTELDAKRQLIGDGFADAGVTFDDFVAWIAVARKVPVKADGFDELEEVIVRKLMPNLPALIKQAKAWVEGGAK